MAKLSVLERRLSQAFDAATQEERQVIADSLSEYIEICKEDLGMQDYYLTYARVMAWLGRYERAAAAIVLGSQQQSAMRAEILRLFQPKCWAVIK